MRYFRILRKRDYNEDINRKLEEIMWKCFYHEQNVLALLANYHVKHPLEVNLLNKMKISYCLKKNAKNAFKLINQGLDKGLVKYIDIRKKLPKSERAVLDTIISDYKNLK